ncbi:DUF397 domain-containing protein [Saccharopolyspora gloriosae]|uniref:DUF397 domain-containing protein n=1 Tax=Saccharopolyspora gloriosae TaxID=455344 RepID=UPI001FB6D9A4|nr:DUF397 domain-containing protein [Saccharopolyspora gloriosae]
MSRADEQGWFKSSYSGPNNNSCVEARITGHGIDIRDSKDPDGGLLSFNFSLWRGFLDRIGR